MPRKTPTPQTVMPVQRLKPKATEARDKQTQAQAIAVAFETLKNAGLLPVSLEARPSANVERVAAQHTYVSDEPQRLNPVVPKDTGLPRSPGAFESTLSDLNILIATTNTELSALQQTLEPFLPKYLFEPSDEGVACKEDTDYEWRNTSDSTLSPTQVALNNAMNELNLLRRRVIRIKNWIVL